MQRLSRGIVTALVAWLLFYAASLASLFFGLTAGRPRLIFPHLFLQAASAPPFTLLLWMEPVLEILTLVCLALGLLSAVLVIATDGQFFPFCLAGDERHGEASFYPCPPTNPLTARTQSLPEYSA